MSFYLYFLLKFLNLLKKIYSLDGTSLVVQWLRLCTSTAGGEGSNPGCGTNIPGAAQCGQNSFLKIHSLE